MKRTLCLLSKILLCGALVATVSCGTTEPVKKKKKPVPPSEDLSGLPWNRPRSFESSAGMGRMMPQSR
ncbi:hypothetical protein [Verrucomicrobium spinosum]|uniref:hypothetical protein n=1 Tax=Verrucomicrobium spinosum TaxID=2736 RepID=UPI0001745005|nr:hypothetical protein [Verrucomicrobium spinosum]